jgi:energy-coupling factor transporter ATP-binding protein EcfA2
MNMDATGRFNPFPGLRAFEPEEDHLFFGRETHIDELLGRLRRSRFLAVVGTSGSGKSSLVLSGLIPSLYGGFMAAAGTSWRVARLRPGDQPIQNLAGALNGTDVLGAGVEDRAMNQALLEATLRRSTLGLAEAVRLANIPPDENILILVDQFEELFRYKRNLSIKDSRDQALEFVRLLIEASQQQETPIYVILTMRSDFIGNCTEFPGLAEVVNDGQFLVPRMNRDERRRTVMGPVAVGGGTISPRLVQRLLNDVGDDQDQLPILQHALMRTWDYWSEHGEEGEPLDLIHYEAVGTMATALSEHADEAYDELGATPEEQTRLHRIVEVMFKALTAQGASGHGIRRPVALREICALARADESEVASVIETFRKPGRSFLMPPRVPLTAETIIDISHESLMRVWQRLVRWVQEESQAALVYERLSKAAMEYERGDVGLWRDPELQLAIEWREATQPTREWADRYDPAFERAMLFLQASEEERNAEIEHKEAQRRKNLRRTQMAAAVFGVAAIAAAGLSFYAFQQKTAAESARNLAVAERARADTARMDAVAQGARADTLRRMAVAEGERAEAARISAETERARAESARRIAVTEGDRAEAARILAEAERARADSARLTAVDEGIRADSARMVAETEKTRADDLRRQALAEALATRAQRPWDDPEVGALLALQAFLFNGREGSPEIYSALRRTLNLIIPGRGESEIARGHEDAVRAVAVDGAGRLVTGSEDGGVRLFESADPVYCGIEDGRERSPGCLGTFRTGVRAVAFSREGDRLAAGTFDGTIRIWDLENLEGPRETDGHSAGVNALAFVGSRLVSAGADGSLSIWSPDALLPVTVEVAPRRPLLSMAVDEGRDRIVTTDGEDLWLWSPGGGAPALLDIGLGDRARIRSLAFGPRGELAVGTEAGPVYVWDQVSDVMGTPRSLEGHLGAVTDVEFASEALLGSVGLDGSLRLWDIAGEGDAVVIADHGSWIWTMAFDAQGHRVFTGGSNALVRTWVTRVQELAQAVCPGVAPRLGLTPAQWEEYVDREGAEPYRETCVAMTEEAG